MKLTVPILQATISRDSGAVLACLTRFPTLIEPGKAVTMKWTVEQTGATSGVEVLDAPLKGTPLEACLVKGVKTFRFPKNSGPTKAMTMPFFYRDRSAPAP